VVRTRIAREATRHRPTAAFCRDRIRQRRKGEREQRGLSVPAPGRPPICPSAPLPLCSSAPLRSDHRARNRRRIRIRAKWRKKASKRLDRRESLG
jgi:hypothetical protein